MIAMSGEVWLWSIEGCDRVYLVIENSYFRDRMMTLMPLDDVDRNIFKWWSTVLSTNELVRLA